MTSFSAVSNQSGFPAALTKGKRLCRSLVDVLLSRVHLAAAAAQAESPPHGDSWRGAATAAQAAVSEAPRPTLQHQLDGASGMAILESAAQLMLRAPPNLGSPDLSAYDLTIWHVALARLLNAASIAQLIQQQPSTQHSEQAVQLLLQLPAKFSPVLSWRFRRQPRGRWPSCASLGQTWWSAWHSGAMLFATRASQHYSPPEHQLQHWRQ